MNRNAIEDDEEEDIDELHFSRTNTNKVMTAFETYRGFQHTENVPDDVFKYLNKINLIFTLFDL